MYHTADPSRAPHEQELSPLPPHPGCQRLSRAFLRKHGSVEESSEQSAAIHRREAGLGEGGSVLPNQACLLSSVFFTDIIWRQVTRLCEKPVSCSAQSPASNSDIDLVMQMITLCRMIIRHKRQPVNGSNEQGEI